MDKIDRPNTIEGQRSAKSTAGQPGHRTQSWRVGDKIVRVDAASIVTPTDPHLETDELQDTTDQAFAAWADGTGTIEMGIGNVVENNAALQQAAEEMAGTYTSVPVETGPLKIKPAWEVDYFPWPRIARRLLSTHHALFDQIGSQILGDLQPTRSRIGICSTFPREGKTTLAICLARWAANSGKRTVLIDADVERPQMTAMTGLDCVHGWRSILELDMPISETMIRSVENGLTFIPNPLGSRPLAQEKVLAGLATIAFQLKYEFDVVIIDLGKIDNVCAHGTSDMDLVDATLITRDPSQTSVGQMMDTRRVLGNIGMTRTYVAQNFARNRVA
ncbi:MAG: tyrosine-protein kinase family protein [Pirellulaceae bacterium]